MLSRDLIAILFAAILPISLATLAAGIQPRTVADFIAVVFTFALLVLIVTAAVFIRRRTAVHRTGCGYCLPDVNDDNETKRK